MIEDLPPDVQALVRERRKIDAIKALRERTGIGLKEAKDRIDAFERQAGIATPMSPIAKSLVYWIAVIVIGLFVYWLSTKMPAR